MEFIATLINEKNGKETDLMTFTASDSAYDYVSAAEAAYDYITRRYEELTGETGCYEMDYCFGYNIEDLNLTLTVRWSYKGRKLNPQNHKDVRVLDAIDTIIND